MEIGFSPVMDEKQREAPRLLLDTNIFRNLQRTVSSVLLTPQRLLDIATCRTPPLLLGLRDHGRGARQSRSGGGKWRTSSTSGTALEWMERLCGNAGMAETLPWILRHGALDDDEAPRRSILCNVQSAASAGAQGGTF